MSSLPTSPDDILSAFGDWNLDEGGRAYLWFHKRRYAALMEMTVRALAHTPGTEARAARILDVGPYLQTHLFRSFLPGAVVNSLGFENPLVKENPGDRHVEFDLNDAQWREKWPEPIPHDLVVMAEVIEHLHTAPTLVLACLTRFLDPGGYLILQTPNASAFPKRFQMLRGRNPFEMIRETPENPGHFREYTSDELEALGRDAGLTLVEKRMENYFDPPTRRGQLFNAASRWIPAGLRSGILMLFRRD